MNAKHMLIGGAVFAATASVFAQTGADPPHSDSDTCVAAPKTRAQVRAEVEQAYREGTLRRPGEEIDYPYLSPPKSTRSRADVRAEVEQAYREGTLRPPEQEVNYPNLPPPKSTRSRAEVRAEVEQAYREGTLHPPGEEIDYPYVYPRRSQRLPTC